MTDAASDPEKICGQTADCLNNVPFMLYQARNMATRRTSGLFRHYREAPGSLSCRGIHSRATARSDVYLGHIFSGKGGRLHPSQGNIQSISTRCKRDETRRDPLLALSVLGVVMAASFVPPTNQQKLNKPEERERNEAELEVTVRPRSGDGEGAGGFKADEAGSKLFNRQQLEASGWERLDRRLAVTYPEFLTSHLLHDTLSGAEGVEGYHVYRDPRHALGAVVAVARLGHRVRGHPNIVHGGATAALLDNSFGFAFFVAGLGNGFTANLTINYRKPLYVGTEVVAWLQVDRVEGRKVFMSGTLRDAKDGSLYAEASSLFIVSPKLRQDVALRPVQE